MILLSFVQLVSNARFNSIAASFATSRNTFVALFTCKTFQGRIEVATQRTSAFGTFQTILMVSFATENGSRLGPAETLTTGSTTIAEMWCRHWTSRSG